MSAGSPATERLTVQFSYNDLPSVAGLFERYPGQIAAVVLEAETVEPPDPDFFNGLRYPCDLASAVGRLPSLRSGVNGQARWLASLLRCKVHRYMH